MKKITTDNEMTKMVSGKTIKEVSACYEDDALKEICIRMSVDGQDESLLWRIDAFKPSDEAELWSSFSWHNVQAHRHGGEQTTLASPTCEPESSAPNDESGAVFGGASCSAS